MYVSLCKFGQCVCREPELHMVSFRVGKGVESLDDYFTRHPYPDVAIGANWAMLVDLENLDINSLVNCVVGQVFRDFGTTCYTSYGVGLERMGVYYPSVHGFDPGMFSDRYHQALNAEWRRVISERQVPVLAALS